MNKKSGEPEQATFSISVRIGLVAFVFCMILAGAASFYWIWEQLLPLYGRIYRNAPVVETPYLMFGLLMAPPGLLAIIVGVSIAAWTGKRFDPPIKSYMGRFQILMLSLSAKTLIYVVPTVMTLTTLTLIYRDYTPCPKLLRSGSAWQLFWVNDERVCFKPTRYINDNWPCKIIGNKDVCIQVDGR